VRHAEKSAASDPEHPGDPNLSEAGSERAEALRRLLARAGVTHAFASEFRRTRETLAPLAADRSIQIEVVPAARLTELARRLRELPPGSLPVVAGPANTGPAIARPLGVALPDLVESASGPMLRDEEYARLFVVTYAVAPPPTDAEAERDDDSSQAYALELAYGA
jgi:hypothetical protein